MAIFKNRPEDLKEFGFGTKVYESNQRLITKNGRSNVKRKGLTFLEELSFYHSLITMSWWKFNLLVATWSFRAKRSTDSALKRSTHSAAK